MAKKKAKRQSKRCVGIGKYDCSAGDGVYWLGLIGAAVYNVSTATGFWMGVWGLIKAIVWPAFVIFELMKFLGM